MTNHNRKYLLRYRRALRKNLTPSEARLWNALKKRNLAGRKFRRQHSIGNYIVDFYCPKEKLVVEVDGYHHFTPSGELADRQRDLYLKSLGIRVIRIPNELVHHKFEIAIEVILNSFTDK